MILIQLTWRKGFRNFCIQRISSERDFKLGPLKHLAACNLSMVLMIMLIMNIVGKGASASGDHEEIEVDL